MTGRGNLQRTAGEQVSRYNHSMSRASLAQFLPWTDRAGRMSWLKLAVFIACLAPAIWMLAGVYYSFLYPAPMRGLIRDTGNWAMRLIVLSLAITPLRYATRLNRLVLVRRMLGLTGLFYTLAHLAIYLVDRQFDVVWILFDIFGRIYISTGVVAAVILVAMGITSNDRGIARLGSSGWNRLHAWIYPAGFLSLLHIFLLVRLNAFEATLISGLCAFAFGFRTLRQNKLAESALHLAALGASLAVITAILEAAFYRLSTGVAMIRVLEANLDFSYQIRPAWWVLAAGLAMASSVFVRRALNSGRDERALRIARQPN